MKVDILITRLNLITPTLKATLEVVLHPDVAAEVGSNFHYGILEEHNPCSPI